MSTRLIFIVGPHRSGTTMLRRVFAHHPDVATTPELHFFDKRHADHRWSDQALRDDFFSFAHEQADQEKYDVLVEKTPVNIFYLERLRRLFPDAPIVAMIRDPREVCASACKRWSLRGEKYLMIAARWLLAVRALERFRARDENVHVVRYEDVTDNPDAALGDLFEKLGLSYQPSFAEVGSTSSFGKRAVGGIRRSSHAEEMFTRSQLCTIDHVLGRWYQRFGYRRRGASCRPPRRASVLFWWYYLHHRWYFAMRKHGLRHFDRMLRRLFKR